VASACVTGKISHNFEALKNLRPIAVIKSFESMVPNLNLENIGLQFRYLDNAFFKNIILCVSKLIVQHFKKNFTCGSW